jgi:pimeloyl-ACP methyl ester carboxylesterase
MMEMIPANGIELAVETFGEAEQKPLILIMGLASQMVAWPQPFCEMLAAKGHRVIRFDNRDCGLSTKIEAGGTPKMQLPGRGSNIPDPTPPPYTLSDMALDVVGLMDALGLERAHICGLSMGGMIAQVAALEHPHRVTSLTSMQSTIGDPDLPPPTAEALAAMIQAPPAERTAYIKASVEVFRSFSGGSTLYDESIQSEISAASFDRCFYPQGFTRQMAAIVAYGNRRNALASLDMPTLVIHGTHDTLVPPEHGRATAAAIPGAQLEMIDQLGHGIAYPGLWKKVAETIRRHTEQAAIKGEKEAGLEKQ